MVRLILMVAALAAFFSPARAIVGGGSAGAAAAHTVMITSRGGDVCSATAIARDLVITAAHCVSKADIYSVSAAGQAFPIARIIVHPGFRRDSFETRKPSPDLAILKLYSPLPASIQPAPLSYEKALPPRGTTFIIAGYGVARERDRASVGTLRTAELPSIGTTGGIMVRLSLGNGQTPRGSCDGDSGGSVYREQDGQLVLHGVIGWATGQGTRGCGGITGATLIGIQIAWIRETAKRLSGKAD